MNFHPGCAYCMCVHVGMFLYPSEDQMSPQRQECLMVLTLCEYFLFVTEVKIRVRSRSERSNNSLYD